MGSSVLSKASSSRVDNWIFSKTVERRYSNGQDKKICFKAPRGLAQGLVLMTRDSREETTLEGGGSLHPQMLPVVGTGHSAIGVVLIGH